MGFCHIHLHTEYSLLDGATKVSELFGRLKELGQDAVAITEHGNMNATIKKYQLAKLAGVRLIFGFEAYVVDDMLIKDKEQKRAHLILLAKDYEGYKNLIRIVSIANSEGFYYKPRIDKATLRKYSKGLIGTSACIANDIARAVVRDDIREARELIREYIDIFGKDDFYLEIQNHGIHEEAMIRKAYYELAKEFDLKIIATCDSHYLKKEDKRAHEIMLCIQTNNIITDPNRFKFNGDGYYVTSESDMIELFKDCPESVSNTMEIAEKCNVDLEFGKHVFPNYEVPRDRTHAEHLHELCRFALKEKYGDASNYKEAEGRMEFELSVINNMGFATYFLIVYDFIKASKDHCQVGPGRGSGAGSIVAYLLGITQLEPLSLGLLFERFLNPDRVSLPDFDVDFGDKEVALEYVKKKYGADKIALIGTFGTMSAKSVVKDVARAFDVPFSVSNDITKYITENTIKKSLEKTDDSGRPTNQELVRYREKYKEVFDIAERLEGCVRHKGIHACGVVWGKEAITEYVPIYVKDGVIVTQIDGSEVESAGLVKFDFLGLETLNITKKIINMIGETDEWLEHIPLDDDKVYEILRKGRSVGVFQLESAGMQKTLKLVKPTCFDDIIAILALYRPGSMDFIDTYAARKDGRETFEYDHPDMEVILKSTHGILVYQEQVMQLSRVLAKFTMGESDVLRKAIGKKKLDLMMKMEEKFKDGCIRFSNMDKDVVDGLWDNIVKFASYSFNKSHAAAYALISYRTAYLRKYYPVEFMTALISSSTNEPEKMAFYLEEARNMGIKIYGPDINISEENFSVETKYTGKCIRFGLLGIKNVGGEALKSILSNRPYKSYQDFVNKVDLSKINKRVQHNIISVGCFDAFGKNRRQLLAKYEDIKPEKKGGAVQMTLFGKVANEIIYPDVPEMKLKEKLELEKEIVGVSISGSALDLYKESDSNEFRKKSTMTDGMKVEVFGIVKKYTPIFTRNNDRMAFITIADRCEECDVTVFPKIYEEALGIREINNYTGLVVAGRFVDDKENGCSIIADDIRFLKPRDI